MTPSLTGTPDVAILGGLTYWSVTFEERLSPEPTAIIGVLAIVGALMISYSPCSGGGLFGVHLPRVGWEPGIQGLAAPDCDDWGDFGTGASMSGSHRCLSNSHGPLAVGCGSKPFLRNRSFMLTRLGRLVILVVPSGTAGWLDFALRVGFEMRLCRPYCKPGSSS